MRQFFGWLNHLLAAFYLCVLAILSYILTLFLIAHMILWILTLTINSLPSAFNLMANMFAQFGIINHFIACLVVYCARILIEIRFKISYAGD